MVEIRGFRGLRFDATQTGALNNVITPPYDVINETERAQLASSNPYNMTHLILPCAEGEQTPAEHAASLLKRWKDAEVLSQDGHPMIYLLRQRFFDAHGAMHERHAFFARLKLPEADEHFVLGHERTFDKPFEDRLALMRATHSNLEPIFLLYTDQENALKQRLFEKTANERPLLRALTADNVTQELWCMPLPDSVREHIRQQTLYIADGHHRFKTACAYRDECRNVTGENTGTASWDFVLAGFVAFEDPGLKIYAAHRVLPEAFSFEFNAVMTSLDRCFECQRLAEDDSPTNALEAAKATCAMIMHTREQDSWLLSLREEKRQELVGDDRHVAWQDLDVAVLHRGILGKLLGTHEELELIYEKEMTTAIDLVNQGKASLAFLLRPTRPEQMRACAEAAAPMPQKSTYFFPKLPSGAVIYAHD